MAVTDKRADIAILRTMGALDGTILRIFLLQGLLISGVGIAALPRPIRPPVVGWTPGTDSPADDPAAHS